MNEGALDRSARLSTWVVDAQFQIRYEIKRSSNVFAKNNRQLVEYGSQGAGARRLVVVDHNVWRLYGEQVASFFDAHAIVVNVLPLEVSEETKNHDTLLHILSVMEKFGLLRRDEPVIAIGGGTLLDIVGMAASIYRRGIPYVRVPTTLVGLVDAAVGVKTAVNFLHRRNRLGTYYPPIACYLDKSFISTLDPLEISSGLGEILKMGVIKDLRLFELLEQNGTTLSVTKFRCEFADEVIDRSIQGMKEELEHNLWEVDLKRLVDFGHSFSPIIEMRSIHDYGQVPLTHGQAVGLDVLFSSALSNARGLMSSKDLGRIVATASNMDLPTQHALFAEPLVLLEALNDTIRHRNGAQNLPIATSIGRPIFLNDVTLEDIKNAASILTHFNRVEGPQL